MIRVVIMKWIGAVSGTLLRDEFLLRFGIVVTAGSGHGLMVSSS